MSDAGAEVRILGPNDGEILREPDGTHDRFLVPAAESGGGFALVEHLLAPRRLAAPIHRHSREDEYTFVLEGSVGRAASSKRSATSPRWTASRRPRR